MGPRLIIQIPCLNERDHLGPTFADLPREIPGVRSIEVLVIDDGSTDGTADVARALGVHYIVRFPHNRGLAAAHSAGLDAAMRLGADIVVNTDADNQYKGSDIPRLVAPILAGQADIAIGDRRTDTIAHFSPLKKLLQRWGSGMVRRVSGTEVADSTSGFRAMNRRAMATLFVHNRFSYTLETIIQAGALGLKLANVETFTNPKTRASRLFRSVPEYLRRNGPVILRTAFMYSPLRTIGSAALAVFLVGLALGVRFVVLFLRDPSYSGHVQSLLVGVGAVVVAMILGAIALLSDLIAANRRLVEELLQRVRRMDAAAVAAAGPEAMLEGIERTGAAPWCPGAPAPLVESLAQIAGDPPLPATRPTGAPVSGARGEAAP